jgi:hypothetical protein
MQECNLNQVFANRGEEEEIFPLTIQEIVEAPKANDKLKHYSKHNTVLDKGLEVSLVDNIHVMCKDTPPLKSMEEYIFSMNVAKINFAIVANPYYSQLLFSSGRSRKLLPQPATTNNKHHDHDRDVHPSGSVILMDLPVLTDGRPSRMGLLLKRVCKSIKLKENSNYLYLPLC